MKGKKRKGYGGEGKVTSGKVREGGERKREYSKRISEEASRKEEAVALKP